MVETILGGVVGFSFFTLTSHPKSPVNKRIPPKKILNLHITPEIKVLLRNRFIHLHHWLIFTSIYFVAQTSEKAFLQSDMIQGFMLGSIAQGLTYEDRFMLIYQATQRKIRGKKRFN